MRYCSNCGQPLDGSRFCSHCGVDNGVETAPPSAGFAPNAAVNLKGISLAKIINWVSIIFFAFVAYFMLEIGFRNLNFLSMASLLYQGIVIPAVLFFALCLWAAFPALTAILNGNKNQSTKIIGASVITVIVMIIACIAKAIFKKVTGSLMIVTLCLNAYTDQAAKVIVFSVLAAVIGFVASYLEKEGK